MSCVPLSVSSPVVSYSSDPKITSIQTGTLNTRIQQTALQAMQAFLYLSTASVLNASVAALFATPTGLGLLNIALGYLLVKLTIKVGLYIAEHQGWIAPAKRALEPEFMDKCRRWSMLSISSCLSLAYPGILIHELGHAAAALGCFKDAEVAISVTPFVGGETKVLITNELTRFGSLLGLQRARLLLILGGIIATTVVALFEFAHAYRLNETNPHAADWLKAHGISLIASDFLYGLGSYLDPKGMDGSDFLKAWTLGVHPVFLLALMVAIPVIQYLIVQANRKSQIA